MSVGGLEFSRQLVCPASWDCKVYRSVGKTLTIWPSGSLNSDHEFTTLFALVRTTWVGASHLTVDTPTRRASEPLRLRIIFICSSVIDIGFLGRLLVFGLWSLVLAVCSSGRM